MIEMLVEAAKVGGVKTLAIVDDAYDPPGIGEISENAFNQFVEAFEDNEEVERDLVGLTSLREEHLEDWEEFSNNRDTVDELWRLHVGGGVIAVLGDQTKEALTRLFNDIEQDRISKLQQLRPLEELLAPVDGALWKLGSNSEPEVVAKADVVFLDLYLSNEVPPLPGDGKIPRSALDQARDRALAYLRAVRSVTQDDLEKVAPAFILISSHGSDLIGQNFRRKARQTASRFRFVSKQAIAGSEPHGLLAIADIFRTCEACAVIEPFQKAFPLIERRNAAAHGITNYLRIDLQESGSSELLESADGVFIIAVWNA